MSRIGEPTEPERGNGPEAPRPDWWDSYFDSERPPHYLAKMAGSLRWPLRKVVQNHMTELRVEYAERAPDAPKPRYLYLKQFEDRLLAILQEARAGCQDLQCPCHVTLRVEQEDAEFSKAAHEAAANVTGNTVTVIRYECGHLSAFPGSQSFMLGVQSIHCIECRQMRVVDKQLHISRGRRTEAAPSGAPPADPDHPETMWGPVFGSGAPARQRSGFLAGLFKKREALPPTREREGQWARQQLLRHWSTIPDGMKLQALSMATEDQLRVLGWELRNPHERLLAIAEAKQRRDRPDLHRKIQNTGELTPEELEQWTAPIQEMHGRTVTGKTADRMYEEVFGSYQARGGRVGEQRRRGICEGHPEGGCSRTGLAHGRPRPESG